MKLFNIVALIAATVLILAFSGCSTTESTGPTGEKLKAFIGGTNGVTLSFAPGTPPPEVFDKGEFPFDVSIILKNQGEADVAQGDYFVRLSGIDPADFSKSSADFTIHPDEDLDGMRKDPEGNIIEGSEVYVDFSGLNYQDELSGNSQFNIRADVCYKYQTVVNSKLCVKEDMLDTEDNAVCTITESKQIQNSGAPVQITSFEQTVAGRDKIAFTFEISHVGSGSVHQTNSDCSTETVDENRVYVEVNTGLSGELSCSGLGSGGSYSGEVVLYEGKRTVRCTQIVDTTADFEKITEIKLTYDYKDDVSSQVLVKHSPSD